MIYLDNAATTPLDSSAGDIFLKYSKEYFFNASAIYNEGAKAKKDLEQAKSTLLKFMGATFNDNLIFTGSATEANNLAINGSYRKNFGTMIFSIGEHPSVYNTALELQKKGVDVKFVNLQPNGEVDYSHLESLLNDKISFISIMHVSNETGAINDLKKIYELKTKYCPKAIFHSDGVQAFGKIKINLEYFGVDLYTISGHKAFAPKGIGALYVLNKNILNPIIYGGGQEYNLRSGTENIAGIKAFEVATLNIGDIKQNYSHVQECVKTFLQELNGLDYKNNSYFSPYVLSLSFKGVNGETLVHMMENQNILISRGSACSSKKAGNRILKNIGLSNAEILGSIRISFSKNSTIDEAKIAGCALKQCYSQLIKNLH